MPTNQSSSVAVASAPPASRIDIHGSSGDLAHLALGALGVVYGDIGTSPLYALRDCFRGEHAVSTVPANVLGVLSLMFWSLTGVIAIKYLTFVMRADNGGEGGQFALLARIPSHPSPTGPKKPLVYALPLLFGAAMLYGDGVLTPAISVLSAVEGLAVSPVMEPWIVPLTCAVLTGLFLIQRRGTARVGAMFGPIMVAWFTTLAVLGIRGIILHPGVLAAVDPRHALAFFVHNGMQGFLALGAIVLCITGGEALYADMGHFGRKPITVAWYGMVMPALLLNYFGQGALVITNPTAISSPLYALVPEFAHYPMVVLATMATVIASQALISGVFSLTNQATQLGYWPRINVIHTSAEHGGQIYLPGINYALMSACLWLVLEFRQSEEMTAAYGLAVTSTMLVTSLGFFAVARAEWGWSLAKALGLVGLFMVFDVAFLSANLVKILEGGWIPLVIGSAMFVLMTTWRRGRELLGQYVGCRRAASVNQLMDQLMVSQVPRVPGTAVFLSSSTTGIPPVLRHHLEHNQVLHEQVVLLSIVSLEMPFVSPRDRLYVQELEHGFFRVVARFGFSETPRVPELLEACAILGMAIDPERISYYLGRETLLAVGKHGMSRWRAQLFAFCARNSHSATAYFHIPPDRVVEIGMQIEL